MRHHCLCCGHGLNTTSFIHVKSLSLVRLVQFSNDDILSGHEEFDSSGTDPFTSWVKMSEHEIVVQHMVDFHKATQISAKHQKGNLLHILSQTVPANAWRPVRLCRGDSASYNWKSSPRRVQSGYHLAWITPMLGRLTVTLLATLSAAGNTGNRSGKEATRMNTCDHSLVQRNVSST